MKTIIIDSGKGGKDFIEKIKNIKKLQIKFIRPLRNMVSDYKKKYVKQKLLELINKLTINKSNININKKYIIIACHSASSCILDILIKNNFLYNNIRIFEPIIPMCLFIKKKNYKNILILSTTLTQKIKWHYRILNSNNIKIDYLTFPLLAKKIENNDEINTSMNRFHKKLKFIKNYDCIVLGCTHYNIIENIIMNILKTKYNFKGVILNSNNILFDFFINEINYNNSYYIEK